MLGREALDGLRGRNWTLVGVTSPAFGLVADIGTVFGPLAWQGLEVFLGLFVVFAVPVLFRSRYSRRCAFPCVVSLILAFSFGVVAAAQKAADAGNQGLTAQQIPGVAELQQTLAAILDRLGVIDTRTQRMAADMAELADEKIGDVLVALGDLAGALKFYRDSLAIRERLAQSDPGNAGWQFDLVGAQWRLAKAGDDPTHRWALVVTTLRALKEANRFSATQAGFLPTAETELAKATNKRK